MFVLTVAEYICVNSSGIYSC